MFFHHVHHVCGFIGLAGLVIKLYKPSESNKLFDGGSLFLYTVGIIIYLTNLRRGGASADVRVWGEVDEHTGINIIAASQVLIVLTFLGVLGLQVGQFWAEIEDQKLAKKFADDEKTRAAAAATAAAAKKDSDADDATPSSGKSTGTATTPVKKVKKSDSSTASKPSKKSTSTSSSSSSSSSSATKVKKTKKI